MTQLQQAQAFSSGAELWICSDYNYKAQVESLWSAQIDWQLNFALSKYHTHNHRELSEQIQEILSETQFPNFQDNNKNTDSILIPCENLLPTKWCLFFSMNPEKLNPLIKQVKKNLNVSTMRLFTPSGWSKDDIYSFSNFEELQVIS